MDIYCADFARAAGETLPGTIKPAPVWLLLQYDGAWGHDALDESELSPAVKARLAAVKGWKTLLIKQGAPSQDGITFFVAVPRERFPALYRFRLDDYEDLLALDLETIAAGEGAPDDEPLFLVCTNGRRDRCCARYGTAVYNALSEIGGDAVWQCTHIGGHRFAANVMSFPHGISYGYVDPGDAARIVEAGRSGRLLADRCRGRLCYPAPVQAAEIFLRERTGVEAVDRLRLQSADPEHEGRWIVRFLLDDQSHQLEIETAETPVPVYASCGAAPEFTPQYRLLRHAIDGEP